MKHLCRSGADRMTKADIYIQIAILLALGTIIGMVL
jgi:hypothetical protein